MATHTSAASGDTGANKISYRTLGYMEKKLLKRAQENMIFERFGQVYNLPKHKTKTARWRRYESLVPATTAITEGVTPESVALKYTNYECTLKQYGAILELTDVVADTHEDPIINIMADLCGEQASETIEYLRYGVLRAGTNVIYAGGAATRLEMDGVTVPSVGRLAGIIDKKTFRLAFRNLKRFRAMEQTQIVGATPNIATEPIGRAFFAVCHTDLDADLREVDGFVPVEKYSSTTTVLPGECGKIENIRFITTTFAEPFVDNSAANDPEDNFVKLSTTDQGSLTGLEGKAIYPILIFGKDSYGIIPMQGQNSVRVSVIPPNREDKSDPLGQRGYVGWKTWNGTAILNETWMTRVECLVSDLGADDYFDYFSAGDPAVVPADHESPNISEDELSETTTEAGGE